jgi:hypothetical protein
VSFPARLPLADFGKAIVATAAMVALLAPLRHLEPAVAAMTLIGLAGMVVYGGLAWWLDLAGFRGFRAAHLKPAAPAAG